VPLFVRAIHQQNTMHALPAAMKNRYIQSTFS